MVGSLVDRAAIDEALDGRDVSGVVHLAGFKYAGVSVSRPLHTYTQNVTGTVVLLEGMAATASSGSSSPPAPRSTAPRTPTWSPKRARPGPSRRTGSRS